jgi:hypothetical protein
VSRILETRIDSVVRLARSVRGSDTPGANCRSQGRVRAREWRLSTAESRPRIVFCWRGFCDSVAALALVGVLHVCVCHRLDKHPRRVANLDVPVLALLLPLSHSTLLLAILIVSLRLSILLPLPWALFLIFRFIFLLSLFCFALCFSSVLWRWLAHSDSF